MSERLALNTVNPGSIHEHVHGSPASRERSLNTEWGVNPKHHWVAPKQPLNLLKKKRHTFTGNDDPNKDLLIVGVITIKTMVHLDHNY